METLTQITGETCCRKVMAMTQAYVDLEALEQCMRNCLKDHKEDCPLYLPMKNTSIPFRQGHLAYEIMKGETQ